MPAPACEQRALCRQYGRTHAGATRRDERHTIVDHGGAAAGLAEVSDQTRTRRIRCASAGFEEHSNDRGGEFWPGAVTSNPHGEKAQSAVSNLAAQTSALQRLIIIAFAVVLRRGDVAVFEIIVLHRNVRRRLRLVADRFRRFALPASSAHLMPFSAGESALL